MRFGLAVGLFVCAALRLAAPAHAADGPPPPPPPAPAPAPAPAVVAATGWGCCPEPSVCRKSRLEIQGHLALLTPDPEGLVSVDSGTPNQTRWDDLDYDPAFGGRVALTFPICSWDVTIAGTWWGQWEGDHTTSGTTLNATPFPGGPPGISPPFDVALDEEATLWDVNLVFTKAFYCTPCFTARWGLGLRWLRFEEIADFTFFSGQTVGGFGADIDNDLYAAEGVVEGVWKLSGSWDFLARGSVFAGLMHREGEVSTLPGGPPLVGTEDENNDFGYGGELELALRWHPNACWSISIGYGLLVLGPVTRAHEALDFSNTDSNDAGPLFEDDTLLVHRVFLGVGFDF